MKENIRNKNNKHQYHGYQEWYNLVDEICYRGEYNNGKVIAYHEFHGGIKTLIYIK